MSDSSRRNCRRRLRALAVAPLLLTCANNEVSHSSSCSSSSSSFFHSVYYLLLNLWIDPAASLIICARPCYELLSLDKHRTYTNRICFDFCVSKTPIFDWVTFPPNDPSAKSGPEHFCRHTNTRTHHTRRSRTQTTITKFHQQRAHSEEKLPNFESSIKTDPNPKQNLLPHSKIHFWSTCQQIFDHEKENNYTPFTYQWFKPSVYLSTSRASNYCPRILEKDLFFGRWQVRFRKRGKNETVWGKIFHKTCQNFYEFAIQNIKTKQKKQSKRNKRHIHTNTLINRSFFVYIDTRFLFLFTNCPQSEPEQSPTLYNRHWHRTHWNKYYP